MLRYPMPTPDQVAEAEHAARQLAAKAVQQTRQAALDQVDRESNDRSWIAVNVHDRYRQPWRTALVDRVVGDQLRREPNLRIQRRGQLGLIPGAYEVTYYLQGIVI